MTQFTQLLDYYLSDEGKMHLPAINKWAKTPGAESDDKLLHYAMEGIRLNGTFGSYRQSTVETTLDDNGRQVCTNFVHSLTVPGSISRSRITGAKSVFLAIRHHWFQSAERNTDSGI